MSNESFAACSTSKAKYAVWVIDSKNTYREIVLDTPELARYITEKHQPNFDPFGE